MIFYLCALSILMATVLVLVFANNIKTSNVYDMLDDMHFKFNELQTNIDLLQVDVEALETEFGKLALPIKRNGELYKPRQKRLPKTIALTPEHIAASVRAQEELPILTIGQLPETGETFTRSGGSIGENYAADMTQPDEYRNVYEGVGKHPESGLCGAFIRERPCKSFNVMAETCDQCPGAPEDKIERK